MIREILSNVYQIKIPLPGNPLKALNSYLIKGSMRSLLVDTGFNWPECRDTQLRAMTSLGVKWDDVDFFITHMHGDHSGLVYELASPDSAVYCSRTDADLIRECLTAEYWENNNAYYIANGYPEKDIQKPGDNPLEWISGSDLNYTYINNGDVLTVGNYSFTCVATPGHTPGHMCLYEPHHKFLLAGDHILNTITSNITSWGGKDDYLGLYLASLDRIGALDIQLVLPGHREVIKNSRERIAKLKQHHKVRLAEIMNILRLGPMTAYQVASYMRWEVRCNSWEEFPAYQKWFAAGEAIAHLEHLAALNEVQTIQPGEKVLYALS